MNYDLRTYDHGAGEEELDTLTEEELLTRFPALRGVLAEYARQGEAFSLHIIHGHYLAMREVQIQSRRDLAAPVAASSRFAVGDRVRYIGTGYNLNPRPGTVVAVDPEAIRAYTVEWDAVREGGRKTKADYEENTLEHDA